jgi:hypothetical protein
LSEFFFGKSFWRVLAGRKPMRFSVCAKNGSSCGTNSRLSGVTRDIRFLSAARGGADIRLFAAILR